MPLMVDVRPTTLSFGLPTKAWQNGHGSAFESKQQNKAAPQSPRLAAKELIITSELKPVVLSLGRKAMAKQEMPSPAPAKVANGGWGMFKDEQSFKEMHFC